MCFLVIGLADILLVFGGFWLQSVFCNLAQNRLKFIGQCLCCFFVKIRWGIALSDFHNVKCLPVVLVNAFCQ